MAGEYSNGTAYPSMPTPVKAVIGLLFCGAAAFVISWPYSLLLHYIPIIYANALLVYVLGLVMGGIAKAALRRLKIHSAMAAVLVGAGGGILAVWFAWLAYFWILANFQFTFYFLLLINPLELFSVMVELANDPVWSFGSSKATGPAVFYYATWLVELGIVVGVAARSCLSFVRENLVCEACGEWVAETGDVARFGLSDDKTVLDRLISGDVSALADLPRLGRDDAVGSWFEAKGYACPDCRNRESMVSVSLVRMVSSDESKGPERAESAVIRYRPINVDMEEKIFDAKQSDSVAGGIAPVSDAGLRGEDSSSATE